MKDLIDYLDSMGPGPIKKNIEDLERAVWNCWGEFDGTQEMEGYKLLHRMESVRWQPPILTFVIERHGATVLGSKYAELQKWELNLDTGKATVSGFRKRLVFPLSSRMNVRPYAEEIAGLIMNQKEDDQLRWNKDGSVRVKIGEVALWGTNKQTIAGRRKRFRKALDELLSVSGWKPKRPNVYERIEGPSDQMAREDLEKEI